MISKLAEKINPYITVLPSELKIFCKHFPKKFTAGFSTGYHRAKYLSVNAESPLSTYQQRNYHHHIKINISIFVYNYFVDDHG